MKLVQGMFSNGFDRKPSPLGLRCDQMRNMFETLSRNAGWYNNRGEKIGYGDLSFDDALRIAIELDEGEYFVLLGEEDSFWKFVEENPGLTGADCTTHPTVDAPGVDYVASKAEFIIGPCKLMIVNAWHMNPEPTKLYPGCPFPFDQIDRDTAKLLLASGPAN